MKLRQKDPVVLFIFRFHAARKHVPYYELLTENKGFSTALILRRGSTIRFGHESAACDT
jgi:hypothetical protein